MPQSLSVVYIHLIFSTKNRRPFLRDKSVQESLYRYLAEISTRLECPAVTVGGVEDHVHLLSRFGRKIKQSEWVKELKRVSHDWVSKQGKYFADFEWQAGYADFSVAPFGIQAVRDYIEGQEEHHRKTTFQDELRRILCEHNQEWDERYVWD